MGHNKLTSGQRVMRRVFAIVFCAALFAAPAANAVIINMDARIIGSKPSLGTSVDVFLDAGTFVVTPIAPPTPGAAFTAWSPFSFGDLWRSDYVISDTGSGDLPAILIGTNTLYVTPALAFANAVIFTFDLATAQTISFCTVKRR